MKYEAVIGLETHVQLRTRSKMFCSCDNTGETQPPNTTICPICMGHPGTLPVANKQAVEWAMTAALALSCTVKEHSRFDRKSYFYPDLPKGYQISQYDQPIGRDGFLIVETPSGSRRIGIERLHVEEDTGKLLHAADGSKSFVDFNRAGTPLLEIVTKPEIRSPEEAKIFLQELRTIMRYLGISDADMEKGHLRCDANISLRPRDDNQLYPKTEIKNMNSFRAVEKALQYEIKRQTKLWQANTPPSTLSTRGWDEKREQTVAQREKEEQHDYRYFPEPDLPLLYFDKAFVAHTKQSIRELPFEKRNRFEEEFELSKSDAHMISQDKETADYFENVISELREWLGTAEGMEGSKEELWEQNKKKLIKQVVNWLISRLFNLLNESRTTIDHVKVTPENFAELMTMIFQHRVNGTTALAILKKMFATGEDPSTIMEEGGLEQIGTSQELDGIVAAVLDNHPDIVRMYQQGKTTTLQFLIGQVMKKTKGRADPEVVQDLLLTHLQ